MDIKNALSIVLSVLATMAKYTATKLDDAAVAGLQAVMNSPSLLDFFEKLLNDESVLNSKDEVRTARIHAMASSLLSGCGDDCCPDKPKDDCCPPKPKQETLPEVLKRANFPLPTFTSLLPLLVRMLLTVVGKRK